MVGENDFIGIVGFGGPYEGVRSDFEAANGISINRPRRTISSANRIAPADLTENRGTISNSLRSSTGETQKTPEPRKPQPQLSNKFQRRELTFTNRNSAHKYLASNFTRNIYPLVETLISVDDPTKILINEASLSECRWNMQDFAAQRNLSKLEQEYLEYTQRLSFHNPYLVACARTNPELSTEFLRQHFIDLSQTTLSNLKDGDYVPLVQIGLGPQGLVAMGEVLRQNPQLASLMLTVDAGKQPGGPFAIPEGAAWKLNSSNPRGDLLTLPKETPPNLESSTVRSFGSPLRFYPGERANSTSREGSINRLVDYLPDLGDFDSERYSDNSDLQLLCALQSAMLAKRALLQTRLVDICKNPDSKSKGNKIITLEFIDESGTKRKIKIRTDAMIVSTGLGEADYGFDLEAKKANEVIKVGQKLAFPKIAPTLEAFKTLRKVADENINIGETIAIWGGGDSAKTLVENICGLFATGNLNLKSIKKIYIFTDKPFDCSQARYGRITSEIMEQGGDPNLVEVISSRADDVAFDPNDRSELAKRKLVFFDRNRNLIKDSKGNVIKADFGIAATGFKPIIDKVFATYVEQLQGDSEKIRMPLTLPGSGRIDVAEVLKVDPLVIFTGTSSDPNLNPEKLKQLPRETQKALKKAQGNAVAIGLRAPDTQAAINIWLNSGLVNFSDLDMKPEMKRKIVDLNDGAEIQPGENFEVKSPLEITNKEPLVKVKDKNLLMLALFAKELGNALELTNNEMRFTGSLRFKLIYDKQAMAFVFEYINDNDIKTLPKKVIDLIKQSFSKVEIQKSAYDLLSRKRSNQSLELALTFERGFYKPRNSYVE